MSSTDFEAAVAELQALGVDCGFHTKQEKLLLWNLAGVVRSGAVVEIGSFEGYSTIILAKAIKASHSAGEVYAIDPHTGIGCESDEVVLSSVGDTWSRFNDNVRQVGVADIVQGRKMTSEEAAESWEKPIGLLFIDGSHRYEDVNPHFPYQTET